MKTGHLILLLLAITLVGPHLHGMLEIRTLTLSRNATDEVREAAETLAGLIERSGGRRPAVRYQSLFGGPDGLRIVTDPQDARFDKDLLTDEFLIERVNGTLLITGSDHPATVHAIYRFAERFLGWRYFRPGELGLERLDVPPVPPSPEGPDAVLYQSRADYLSRNLHGLNTAGAEIPWSDWHGLRERLVYNHTLHRVIPPTRFDTHPEWFAKDAGGKPMRPPYYPRVHGYNDHPDLSHPEVRKWVIERTTEALEAQTAFSRETHPSKETELRHPPVRQSPGLVSTSISLGDSFVFGEFPEDYPWKPDGYFRRWPDWSNHVFAYSNALAEGLAEIWESGHWNSGAKPDLRIGVLAYLNWENVPDFAPHPALVPYLTYDRTQWYDPDARADDLSTVERWNRATDSFLGTWDYTFGSGFFIPRSLVGIQSEAIPALHARGVRAYFCQVGSLWPYDGHTTWLAARLLWDTGLNANEEVDTYFREFFGPAEGPMRHFFELAESAWMSVEGSGWWLRYWRDPWQIVLLDEAAMERMRDALGRALALTRQPSREADGLDGMRFHRRIRQVHNLFRMTELLSRYHRQVWDLQQIRWDTASRQQLETGLAGFENAWDARLNLTSLRDELAGNRFPFHRGGDLSWVFEYEGFGPVLAEYRDALASAGAESLLESSAHLMEEWAKGLHWSGIPAPGSGRQILYDTGFDHLDDPRIWHRQLMDSPGMLLEKTDAGLEAVSIRRGLVYQLFRAGAGSFYQARAELETHQSPSGEIYLRVDFFDEDHNRLRESLRGRIAPTRIAGASQRIRMLAQAPPETAYGRVVIRFYEMDPGSSATVRRIQVQRYPSLQSP